MANIFTRLYWTAFTAWSLLGQARYPWSSPQRIARDRDRNVRRMVRYAYRWVPYYRETLDRLGLTPGDFRTFDDLRQLPLISVADLQERPEAFRSTQFADAQLQRMGSSGSTGSPHSVWHHLGSLYTNSTDAERERRMLQKAIGRGWRYRHMSLDNVQGHAYRVRSVTRANALWPRWLKLRGAVVEDNESLEHMVGRLNALKPDQLGGFGSTIGELFTHLDATGEPFHRPRLVRYASEALPEAVRHLLVDKYNIEVFSAYQSVEGLKMGWECDAHQGYHINADHYPIRMVNDLGQDVADGETGEIVLCNLTNRGTVLLNYRMGDLAARMDAPCPCGRGLPRIGWIEGRTSEYLVALDGRRVPFSMLSGPIWRPGGVWQWQVIQQARNRLLVLLRLAPTGDLAALTAGITERARSLLGDEMMVEVRAVDEIPKSAGGKVRQAINETLR